MNLKQTIKNNKLLRVIGKTLIKPYNYCIRFIYHNEISTNLPNTTILRHGAFGTFISDSAKIGEHNTIYHNVTIGDNVILGNNVTIYTGCVIINNAKIGDNVTIGANTFINTDIPNNSTVYNKKELIIKTK